MGPNQRTSVREYLNTGHGLRFCTEVYGSEREKTVFHENLQEYCFVFTKRIRTPPETFGSLREDVIYLGILCPSSIAKVLTDAQDIFASSRVRGDRRDPDGARPEPLAIQFCIRARPGKFEMAAATDGLACPLLAPGGSPGDAVSQGSRPRAFRRSGLLLSDIVVVMLYYSMLDYSMLYYSML